MGRGNPKEIRERMQHRIVRFYTPRLDPVARSLGSKNNPNEPGGGTDRWIGGFDAAVTRHVPCEANACTLVRNTMVAAARRQVSQAQRVCRDALSSR